MPKHYEVQSILEKKVEFGRTFYKIKWEGYPIQQATWQPKKYLTSCPQMLEQFHKAIGEPQSQSSVQQETKQAQSNEESKQAQSNEKSMTEAQKKLVEKYRRVYQKTQKQVGARMQYERNQELQIAKRNYRQYKKTKKYKNEKAKKRMAKQMKIDSSSDSDDVQIVTSPQKNTKETIIQQLMKIQRQPKIQKKQQIQNPKQKLNQEQVSWRIKKRQKKHRLTIASQSEQEIACQSEQDDNSSKKLKILTMHMDKLGNIYFQIEKDGIKEVVSRAYLLCLDPVSIVQYYELFLQLIQQ